MKSLVGSQRAFRRCPVSSPPGTAVTFFDCSRFRPEHSYNNCLLVIARVNISRINPERLSIVGSGLPPCNEIPSASRNPLG